MTHLMNCANYPSNKTPLSATLKTADEFILDDIKYCPKTQTVTYRNQPRKITAIEWVLLNQLLENQGRIVTIALLEQKIYEKTHKEEITSNVLAVHMHNLRRKFPELTIKTIRGVGYVLKQI